MKNIILIGMPACGKSSVGVILAKTAAMSFVDTDLLLQEKEGRKLQYIIDDQGMDEFLKIEERILSSVNAENAVISTGGSAVYSEGAMAHLKSVGTVVYLKLSLSEIDRRLKNIKTRGIAFGPGENLQTLYEKRVPVYEAWADKTVTADPRHNNIEHMAEAIISALTC